MPGREAPWEAAGAGVAQGAPKKAHGVTQGGSVKASWEAAGQGYQKQAEPQKCIPFRNAMAKLFFV